MEKSSLYFDNFFTSAKLIRSLRQKSFGVTGTVRDNRTECCLLGLTEMKKQKRGVMDCAVDKKNNIVGVRWKDNNIVTILSNEFGMNSVQKCSRYSLREKSKLEIDQPNVIKYYNRQMSGVDQLDNHVSNYRIVFREKKMVYTNHLLDDRHLCYNAYILTKRYGYNKDNLERDVAKALLSKYGTKSEKPGLKRAYVTFQIYVCSL